MTPAQIRKLTLADLKKSGLDKDMERLYITPLDDYRPTGSRAPVAAYEIRYFDMDGKPNCSSRIRLLEPYRPPKAKKDAKYLQTPGSETRLYFAPYVDWLAVSKDPDIPVWIVEGEKKAASMCKLGYPAIGLGGVFNFLTRDDWDEPSHPIDDMVKFPWENHKAIIMFDSDAYLKAQVRHARDVLRDQLITLKANPFKIALPTLTGQAKTGADDYIVYHGKHARREIDKLVQQPLFIPENLSMRDLMAKKLPPKKEVIQGLLPPGAALLAGPPKIGKSFLSLAMIHAVVTGDKVMGAFKTAQSRALYIALEDDDHSLQKHIRQLNLETVDGLDIAHEWPRAELGLMALDRYLTTNPGTGLVIVDTKGKFMGIRQSKNQNLYNDDYAEMGAFKEIADNHNTTIVVIHHTKKGATEDPFEQVSGSLGLTGAADTIIVLKRSRVQSGATGNDSMDGVLHVTGRGVREQELAVRFEDCRWTVLGNAAEVAMAAQHHNILEALKRAGKPLGPTEIGMVTGHTKGAVYRQLQQLVESGFVAVDIKGCYALRGVEKGGKY